MPKSYVTASFRQNIVSFPANFCAGDASGQYASFKLKLALTIFTDES